LTVLAQRGKSANAMETAPYSCWMELQ